MGVTCYFCGECGECLHSDSFAHCECCNQEGGDPLIDHESIRRGHYCKWCLPKLIKRRSVLIMSEGDFFFHNEECFKKWKAKSS